MACRCTSGDRFCSPNRQQTSRLGPLEHSEKLRNEIIRDQNIPAQAPRKSSHKQLNYNSTQLHNSQIQSLPNTHELCKPQPPQDQIVADQKRIFSDSMREN